MRLRVETMERRNNNVPLHFATTHYEIARDLGIPYSQPLETLTDLRTRKVWGLKFHGPNCEF